MKKKIMLYNQIDYLFEAHQMLCLMAEKGTHNQFEEFEKRITQRYGVNSEHVKSCLALVEEIWNRVNPFFEKRMEQVKTLFGEIENRIIPAELILCWGYLMPEGLNMPENTEPLRQAYAKMSREEKDAFFFRILTHDIEGDDFAHYIGNESGENAISDVERVCNIFSYIQKMEIKQESKLRIQEVYLRRDMYFEQIVNMMDETIAILKEYEDRMLELIKLWEEYWGKMVEEGNFLDALKTVLEIDNNRVECGFCVIPSVIQSAALWLNMDAKNKKVMPTCRIGIMLTEQFNWNSAVKEEFRIEEMVSIWKALGDKSKMDILLFIKDRPAYGSEIAKQFSLTTATVSHHMNKLLQLRLVQADLKDGKVYYQVRKEVLQEVFEHAKHLFS